MAPDWATLGDEYDTSSSVVIGKVDCTEDNNKDLCSKYEVKGYPTLKYFSDGDAEPKAYEGGRDLAAFQTFVKETLEVACQVEDPSGCTEKEVAFLTKMKAAAPEELVKQNDRLKGMSGKSMAPDLKKWVNQRLNILTQLTK
eukprot:CAMPEP_0196581488 /NCGR_PEP_ID=MMETSP1081-20130531/33993_1 /TAXON_ID=36882 /ORGANISM="Pyramimonas amylifera, Strain CCMP720" /LENGTH=141 /DNA_ID=CAMNT_0041901735 /DNA_START=231 /DNA_END=656 /DNA_ORIENTATION=+